MTARKKPVPPKPTNEASARRLYLFADEVKSDTDLELVSTSGVFDDVEATLEGAQSYLMDDPEDVWSQVVYELVPRVRVRRPDGFIVETL